MRIPASPPTKMIDKIFPIILLFSTIAYTTNISLNMFDIIFFRLSAMVLFVASLFDTPKRNIRLIAIPVAGLLGIGLVNLFIHSFKPVILSNIHNLFLACVIFTIVYAYITDVKKCVKYILIGCAINLIVFLGQKMGFNPILNQPGYVGTEGGIMGNISRLGIYLALIAPFLSSVWLGAFFVLGIIFKQHAITAIVAIIFFMRGKEESPQKFIVILSALAGLFLFRQHLIDSLIFRWSHGWKIAIEGICQSPLFGYGAGWTPQGYEVIANSYLQAGYGLGLGILAWIGWMIYKLKLSARQMLLPLLVLMSIEYPIETPRFWILIITITVFAAITNYEEGNNLC